MAFKRISLFIFIIFMAFNLFILTHEFMHFIVAVMLGYTPEEFFVGVGTTFFSFNAFGTTFSFNMFPFMGGVIFPEGFFDKITSENLNIIFILLAGGISNILMGLSLVWIIGKFFKPDFLNAGQNVDKVSNGFYFIFVAIYQDLVKNNSYSLVFSFLGFFSIAIGIFNLIPIYPLDGGKIVMILLQYFQVEDSYIKIYQLLGLVALIYIFFKPLIYDFIYAFRKNNFKEDKQEKVLNTQEIVSIILFSKFVRDMKDIGYTDSDLIEDNFLTLIQDFKAQGRGTLIQNIIKYMHINNNNLFLDKHNRLTPYSIDILKELKDTIK